MEIFGRHMYNGCPISFIDNKINIEKINCEYIVMGNIEITNYVTRRGKSWCYGSMSYNVV